MNNNRITASALEAQCKGVFSKTSYITIGSEELSMMPISANSQLLRPCRCWQFKFSGAASGSPFALSHGSDTATWPRIPCFPGIVAHNNQHRACFGILNSNSTDLCMCTVVVFLHVGTLWDAV